MDQIFESGMLISNDIDLICFKDPIPLAMMEARDRGVLMALAAAANLSPQDGRAELMGGVVAIKYEFL